MKFIEFLYFKNLNDRMLRQPPTKARERSHDTRSALQTELNEKSKAKKIEHSRTFKIQETFKCTNYNLSETSIQVLLKFQLIEKRNCCAHLSKCSAVWCQAKEEIRARTAFFMLN